MRAHLAVALCAVGAVVALSLASGCATAEDGVVFPTVAPTKSSPTPSTGSAQKGQGSAKPASTPVPSIDGSSTDEPSPPAVDPVATTDDKPNTTSAGDFCDQTRLALVASTPRGLVTTTFEHGQWSPPATGDGTAVSRPTLASAGSGFIAIVRTASNELWSSRFEGTSWSPWSLAFDGAFALDEPRLIPNRQGVDLVFQRGGNLDGYLYATSTWSQGAFSAPSLIATSTDKSFAPRSPSVTSMATGRELVIAHAGDDGNLYVRNRSTTWNASERVPMAAPKKDLPTAVVENDDGSLLVVYSEQEGSGVVLKFVAKRSGAWAAPVYVHNANGLRAHSSDPLSLVSLPGKRALLVFRSTDGNLWASEYDGTGGVWSAPASVTSTSPRAPSSPSLVRVGCGSEAALAYIDQATTAPVARVVPYRSSTWGTPLTAPGTPGATFVGLGASAAP